MATARKVYLPLEKIDYCFQCKKPSSESSPLRFCISCAEALYCSEKCQKDHWPTHKSSCGRGKTDRVELTKFYPFLACLAEAARFNQTRPLHRALQHTVLNNPGPGANPTALPDGSAANLVILGEKVPLTEVTGWWPLAATSEIRSKLSRRIQREGYLLPILTSICVSLLQEMYTTSPDEATQRRVRLKYNKSPIADFGIAKGRAHVKNQDKLAYLYLSDGTFEPGQDPDEHYWLYFTTLSGQKVTLDVGMFTFNFCLYVSGQPYFDHIPVPIPSNSAAAYFKSREMARSAADVTTTSKEFSVLRNKALQEAIGSSSGLDWQAIYRFMGEISGKKCTAVEAKFVKNVSSECCRSMARVIQKRAWEKWLEEPMIGIETDPGEMDGKPSDDDEDWWKYMQRWNRKYNRGKVSADALREAFVAFRARRASRDGAR